MASNTATTPWVPNISAIRTQQAARDAWVRSNRATTLAAPGDRPSGRGGSIASGMSTSDANMSQAASSNFSLSPRWRRTASARATSVFCRWCPSSCSAVNCCRRRLSDSVTVRVGGRVECTYPPATEHRDPTEVSGTKRTWTSDHVSSSSSAPACNRSTTPDTCASSASSMRRAWATTSACMTFTRRRPDRAVATRTTVGPGRTTTVPGHRSAVPPSR